jgi:hypothetical protein
MRRRKLGMQNEEYKRFARFKVYGSRYKVWSLELSAHGDKAAGCAGYSLS